MAEYKLKIKVGEHEFEAEGPADVVQAQFAAFKDLVSSMAVQKPAQDAPVAEVEKPPGKPDVPANKWRHSAVGKGHAHRRENYFPDSSHAIYRRRHPGASPWTAPISRQR